MTKLYAQPYDLSACGFYFSSADEYRIQSSALRNDHGQPVEEFEIEFIEGEDTDSALFEALSVNQLTVAAYFEAVEDWREDDKIKVIIAVGQAGYGFMLGTDNPDKFDVEIYTLGSLQELAMQFVDEHMFGEIPAAIQNYIDYDAIAHDLAMEYDEVEIGGYRYIYRCG